MNKIVHTPNLLDLDGLRAKNNRDKKQIVCAWCDEAEELLKRFDMMEKKRPKNDG